MYNIPVKKQVQLPNGHVNFYWPREREMPTKPFYSFPDCFVLFALRAIPFPAPDENLALYHGLFLLLSFKNCLLWVIKMSSHQCNDQNSDLITHIGLLTFYQLDTASDLETPLGRRHPIDFFHHLWLSCFLLSSWASDSSRYNHTKRGWVEKGHSFMWLCAHHLWQCLLHVGKIRIGSFLIVLILLFLESFLWYS